MKGPQVAGWAVAIVAAAALATRGQTLPGGEAAATQPTAWTTLFRGDDAALWDTDAGDADTANGYAQKLDAAPANVRYVRMKRMDTGETVILEITRDALAGRAQLPGQFVLWSGGVPTWREGDTVHKFLGIAEYAFAAREKGDFYNWQSGNKGDTGYGGFGFGKATGSPEAVWLWEGKSIDRTVFEIAVTGDELSAEERKTLLQPGKLEVFSAKWGPPGGLQVDVIKKLAPFLKNDGDLEMLVSPANLGDVATTVGVRRELAVSYAVNGEKRSLTLPETRNLWLIAPATRGGPPPAPPIDRSAQVAPPQADASGWTVLFRADDPSLWNRAVGNPDMINGFAAAIDGLSIPMQYLRLRRLDTGESVIMPITRGALAGKVDGAGVLVWSSGTQTWRGVRLLGIAQEAGPAEKAGDLFVYRDGLVDGGLRGWGFGKAVGAEGRQAYCWNGQGIDQTVFEIAVTNRPLTPAERGSMLVPGKLNVLNARWGPAGKLQDLTAKLKGQVVNGALEVPLVPGELLGPAIAGQVRQLDLSVEINGVRSTRTWQEGETVSVAAPVALAPVGGGLGGALPTMGEITASMDAGDYAATLKLINQVAGLTGEGARAYDRYALLLDRAECQLQTKDRAGAMGSAQLATKVSNAPEGGAQALAFLTVLQRSASGEYVAPGSKPPGLPILKAEDRKAVYQALWKEQLDLMTKHAPAADAATLPVLQLAAADIPLARAAEFAATGTSTKTQTHATNLARHGVTLITQELTKDTQRTEDIFNDATANHVIKPDEATDLRTMLATCDALPAAIAALTKSLGNEVLFTPLGATIDKLRARIREVGTRRY